MPIVSATKTLDTSWLPGWNRQRRLEEIWPNERVVWCAAHTAQDEWGRRCLYPAPPEVTTVLALPPMRYAFHTGGA